MQWREVFLSPYKRIKKDFAFLENYGFTYESISKHNVRPCVVFRKSTEYICVCFDYECECFYITIHINGNDILGTSMLPNCWQDGLSDYKSQLPIVKDYIQYWFKQKG